MMTPHEARIYDRTLVPNDSYDGPGVYEITCNITTRVRIDDPNDIHPHLHTTLTNNDPSEVEITVEYDHEATQDYIAAERADAYYDDRGAA